MSEICLDCYNKQFGTHYTEKDVKLEMDLCEDCGQIKPTIVVFRCRSFKEWLTRRYDDFGYYAWKLNDALEARKKKKK